jgi:hypothetical protein
MIGISQTLSPLWLKRVAVAIHTQGGAELLVQIPDLPPALGLWPDGPPRVSCRRQSVPSSWSVLCEQRTYALALAAQLLC